MNFFYRMKRFVACFSEFKFVKIVLNHVRFKRKMDKKA